MKKRSLGFAFIDQVRKVTIKNRKPSIKTDNGEWKDTLLPNFDPNLPSNEKNFWLTTLFSIICLIFFFVIFLRLFHLQIVKGQDNRGLADGNRIQIKIIHAPRGVIFDRNGKILAANSPAFRLFDKDTKRARLISREEALELEVKKDPLFYDLEVDNVRNYPYGEKLAHVVGYVGEISEEELKKSPDYHLGDRIGKVGIEAQYEEILRGVDGGEIIEVDSLGKTLRTLRRQAPIAGQNIYLTIDAVLQEKTYQLTLGALNKVNSCCAAALAVDPKNGEVLVLLSLPSFDPNIFTKDQDEAEIAEIFTRSDSPALNRAIGGTYPPGSTFKIVSALAALTSGKITPSTQIEDTGQVFIGQFTFANWYFTQYGKVEGSVNLVRALKRSTDTYFYRVGQIIGEKPIISWSRKLKLGDKLGIDIPGEVTGLVPDGQWKRKVIGDVWYPGDTLHLSIGQGFINTTPIQILGITSFVANEGVLNKPRLLLKLEDQKEKEAEVLVSNIISQDQINVIKKGLAEVPKDGGTAWPFFSFPIPTSGKTGTAEYGDAKGRTHAWYTSYAPADEPKIVMTVLIESGGEGSTVAAPVIKEVYRWYFSEDKNKLIQDIGFTATESAKTLGE